MNDAKTFTRTAIITGGTSGLGFECAKALLGSSSTKWKLILAARNEEAGKKSATELNREFNTDAAEYLGLDLGSFHSVNAFSNAIKARSIEINLFICNAGLQFSNSNKRTEEGFEATFGINHLGHFLLLNNLLEILSDDARILIVSSGTHDPNQKTGMPAPRFIDPELLAKPEIDAAQLFKQNDAELIEAQRRYTTSKLCNLYFCYELQRRLKLGYFQRINGQAISVNAFDPGLMPGTGLARDYPAYLQLAWKYLLPIAAPLLKLTMGNVNSPTKSGSALAWLAESEQGAASFGGYFEGKKPIASSIESYDEENANLLWRISEKLIQHYR